MVTSAEIIQQHREEIIERWLAEAGQAASARGLSTPELRNVMPLYLSALGHREHLSADLRQHLENHLSNRIRLGFELTEIVEEFILLERCIVSLFLSLPAEHRPSEEEKLRLSNSVQATVLKVAQLFQEHMQFDEQREKLFLRRIQIAADEALRSPDEPSHVQLSSLLELMKEAMAAQTVALLLYEPATERLIAAGAVGLAQDEIKKFAETIAPSSLSGHAAAAEEPTTVRDIETTELTVSDTLRYSGIHSLVALRLPPHRKLFGVLYVGLRETRPFSARELRRLEALAERITLHLENARLYTELRQSIAELGLEREVRDRFMSILAHDLRGPLASAKMGAELLSRSQGIDDKQALISRIDRNLERADRMICDLLDVSRLRAGQRLPVHLADCDLHALADDVAAELSSAHGDRFTVVAEGSVHGVWGCDELRRALWNLGVNAVKYGTRDSRITIRVNRTTDAACVSVHNLGNPIPAARQAQVFDLYSRIRESAGTGWGLGLALVQACAEAHGGKATVESTREAGTTFTIALPFDSRPFQQAKQDQES